MGCLAIGQIIEMLNTFLAKHAENAICRDGLFVLSLHSKYVAKIVMMSEGMARLMHEELEC